MRDISISMVLLASINFAVPGVGAADFEKGKAKSVICQACHGVDGISPNDRWPNLNGQKKGYLVAQLEAFRARERIDESMQLITKKLTDEDIENLALYYSRLP